mmetsp:Transcript_53903/g.121043  ORF Transcript_53903/g.121043 Transcript_53903/m.121043 type:complete len:582 (-) Transcript_53903:80-1825(-)
MAKGRVWAPREAADELGETFRAVPLRSTYKPASSSTWSAHYAGGRSATEHWVTQNKSWKKNDQAWTDGWAADEWWLQANKWKVTRVSKAAIRLLQAQPQNTMTGSKFAQTLFQECPEAREVFERVRLQYFCQYVTEGQVEFQADDENPSRHYVWLRSPAKRPGQGLRDGYSEDIWQQKHRPPQAGALERKARADEAKAWVAARVRQEEGESSAAEAQSAVADDSAGTQEQVNSRADAIEAHVDLELREQDEVAAQLLKSMDPKAAAWYLTDTGHITLNLAWQSWSDWDVKELLLHKTNWIKEELARRLWRSQGAGLSWYWIGVDFSHNQLTASSVQTLKQFLSIPPLADRLYIKILKLHHCNLQDAGMNAVADLLVRQSRPVHEVHLSHNAATDYGAAIVLGAIALHPQNCYPFATQLAKSPHEERWRAMRLRMEYNQISSPKEVLQEAERVFKCRSQLKESDTSKSSKDTCAMLSYGYFEMQTRRHSVAEVWQVADAVEEARAKLVAEILPAAAERRPDEVQCMQQTNVAAQQIPEQQAPRSMLSSPVGREEAVKELERDFQASVESFLQGQGEEDDEDW